MARPFRLFRITLACLVLAPGLAHGGDGQGDRQADADVKEIASYRLTTGALKKVMNINRTLVSGMMKDPKLQQAMRIRQELDALEEKDELTAADERRIEELEKRLEGLGGDEPLDPFGGGDARSLSEMEAGMRKYPPMMKALEREGMTPREYATFWLAFMQAAFAHGFQKSGMLNELPPGVSPENVKFIGDHADEIEGMQRELESLGAKRP